MTVEQPKPPNRIDARDVCAIVGVALVAVGLWLTSPSAAIVTVGVILLAAGVYGHLRPSFVKPPKTEGDE